jgi:hypothetical protein
MRKRGLIYFVIPAWIPKSTHKDVKVWRDSVALGHPPLLFLALGSGLLAGTTALGAKMKIADLLSIEHQAAPA